MCTTCGCAAGETRIENEALKDGGHWHQHADGSWHHHHHGDEQHQHGEQHSHAHRHADGSTHAHPHDHDHPHDHAHAHGHDHDHDHDHDHGHGHGHDHLHYGQGPAGAHAPGMSQARMVQIERDILSKNDSYADANRKQFAERGIFALNLVSSPGSGKTTLLCRSIAELKARLPIAVIEGDQQTSQDAERIRATGVPALQINTGKGCHLDAYMVGQGVQRLAPADDSLLFIENVGNLVCPAAFDLGEAHKVAILSVTEGEDKPLKYPDMFRAASLMLLNKVDLLPYLNFDVELAVANARRVNPDLIVLRVSATTGEGFAEWLDWIEQGCAGQRANKAGQVAALQQRIAELEAQLAAARGA